MLASGTFVLAVLALPASAELISPTAGVWTQYQGGATHPGADPAGPKPPYVTAWPTPFAIQPGGPFHSYGLSAPVVGDGLAVVVGPTAVYGVSLKDASMVWTVDRDFGPSVPAAIVAVSPPGSKVAAPAGAVLFTEGFGTGPGAPGAAASASASAATSASVAPSPAPTAPGAAESHVAAITADTGTPLWKPLALKAVSRTGVTVDGSTAFVGDIRGNVYAIDAATGKLNWSVKLDGYIETSLAAAGGKIFVAVQGSRTTNGKLYALDEATGKVAWTYDVGHPALLTTPSVAGTRLVIGVTEVGATGTFTSLQAVDAGAGSLLWRSRLTSPLTYATAPVISGTGAFVLDSSGEVYRMDLSSGARSWDFALNTSSLYGGPVVSGGVVAAPASAGRMAAIDAASGKLLWQAADTGGPLRFGAVAGDLLLFTRGGPEPGLVAFRSDPSAGPLTSISSPTTPRYGAIILNWAIVALPLGLILVLGLRPLAAKMGPAFVTDDEADPRPDAAGEGDEG